MALNYEDYSWTDVKDLLRKWRESTERKSDNIVQLWEAVLEEKMHKLGNERLIILEQVVIAALDCGRVDIAENCMCQLMKEFPDSMRVQRLKAMRFEVLECYDKALEILDSIIKKDETNPAPRKRKVAILKAKGMNLEAIAEICDYLTKFMSDQEAWHELCNLYLQEADYEKAVFCMEELLLHNPHSYLLHLRLADIRYTMGGTENMETAKTYYLYAIKLNPNNVRALYGLYLCCMHIGNSKAVLTKRKDAQTLGQWALTQIAEKNSKRKAKTNNKYIEALDSAFANMDIKSK